MFDYPQRKLSAEDYWALMPPEELEVFEKLEEQQDAVIGDVTDAVFQGIRTSANKIYVVDVLDADRVESDDTGETVTIVPTGETQEYEIETDLLRPFLEGDEVKRWRGEWGGLHVVHPYHANENKDGELEVGLYSRKYLQEHLPRTWDFFLAHKEELEGRENGRKEGEDDWYGYIYPKNLGKFENPKFVQAEIANNATYLIDEVGTWYFTTGYGVSLTAPHRGQTVEMACQLNSKALDFYFKHIAAIKAGGFYSYRTQYVEKLPCVTEDSTGLFGTMRDRAEEIVATIDLDSKTDRFPEAYLGDYDGELDYISYEWQTRRYPVNAEVQGDVDGNFTVQAGRSDTVSDPAMYSDDRDARKRRAEYVHAAVDGRNVKSGEETTIPIPRSDAGVEELLDRLDADREEVRRTDIDELEADIDEAVYDLFDLTEEEREVVEDYLEVF